MTQAQTPIYVINLPQSTARKSAISSQLNDIGVDFEIFRAVDGRTDELPSWPRYDEEKAIQTKCWPLNAGQLGCFYSHVRLWRCCVESGRPLIVIEDDALILKDAFQRFLEQCHQIPERFGCVRLFTHRRRQFRLLATEQIAGLALNLYNKGHITTTGYYLQPSAAEVLLSHADNFFLPVDLYLDRFWQHGVLPYGVQTACLSPDPALASDIGARAHSAESQWRKQRTSWLGKIRRERFRFNELFRRKLWWLQNRDHLKRMQAPEITKNHAVHNT